MTKNRSIIINVRNGYAWESVVDPIDQAFQETYTTFLSAVLKPKKNELNASIRPKKDELNTPDPKPNPKAIFWNGMWDKLNLPISAFKSLTQLKEYYAKLGELLELNIKDCCMQSGIPEEVIMQKSEMLLLMIQVYGALLSQKFLLNQFQPGDEAYKFNKEFMGFKQISDIFDYQSQVDDDQINNMLGKLNYLSSMVMKTLKFKKYPLEFEMETIQDNDKYKSSFHERVKKKLEILPEGAQLNPSMEGIKEAVDRQDNKAIEKYKTELNNYKNNLQVIKDELNELMTNNLLFYDQYLTEQLVKQSDSIDIKLAFINEQKHIFDILNLLVEITNNNNDLKTMSAKIPRDGKLIKLLPNVTSELEKFVANYGKELFKDASKLYKTIEKMRTDKENLDTYATKLAAKLAETKNILILCNESITKVQTVLESYIQTPSGFLKTFFADHWPKMAIGASSGIALGTLLSFFYPPSALGWAAIEASSFTLGGAGAAGIGLLAKDTMATSKKENENKENKEAQPTQPNSLSFWQRWRGLPTTNEPSVEMDEKSVDQNMRPS